MQEMSYTKSLNALDGAHPAYIKSSKVVCLLENDASYYDDLNTFLRLGHNVIVITKDATNADRINKGYFKNAGRYEAVFRAGIETNRLSACQDLELAICDVDALVLSADKANNLQNERPSKSLQSATMEIGRGLFHAQSYKLVVVRQVLRPGQMEEFIIPLLESASGKCCGKDFGIAYMPASADLWESALAHNTTAYAVTDETSDEAVRALYHPLAPIMHCHAMSTLEAAGFMEASWEHEKELFARKMAASTFRNVLRSSDVFNVLGRNHPMADLSFRSAYDDQARTLDRLLSSIKGASAGQITFLGSGFLNDLENPKVRFARKLFDQLCAENFRLSVLDQRTQNVPSVSRATPQITPCERPISDAWDGWASPSFKPQEGQELQSGLILLVNEPESLNDLAERLGEDANILDLSLFFPCS